MKLVHDYAFDMRQLVVYFSLPKFCILWGSDNNCHCTSWCVSEIRYLISEIRVYSQCQSFFGNHPLFILLEFNLFKKYSSLCWIALKLLPYPSPWSFTNLI